MGRWLHCEENEDGTTTATTSEGDIYVFPFTFEQCFMRPSLDPVSIEIANQATHIPARPDAS